VRILIIEDDRAIATNLYDFLTGRGHTVDAAGDGVTGLHLAAHEGHLDTVKLLLARNAPLEAKNIYGGTVLGQTLWSVIHHPMPSHREIVETLLAAGAKVEDDWFTGNRSIDELLLRARSDRQGQR